MRENLKTVITIGLLMLTSVSFAEDKGKCDDSKFVYKFCTNQQEIFNSHLDQAKKEKKLLLVKFGFEKCPWCLNLHKVFNTNLKTFIDKNFVKAEINISEESGKKVFENIKGSYKESYKKTGWPFLIVVNPQANTSTYQDTAELEDNAKGQKGHDIAKVKMALENMAKKLN